MFQPICSPSYGEMLNKLAFEFISFKVTPQQLSPLLHLFACLGFLSKRILKEKLTIEGGTLGGDVYFKKMLGILALFVLHLIKSLAIDNF